jgi:ADP-ribosylglycohydrolase
MIGAIAGDIVGSRFEHLPHKWVEFELWHRHCRFTDDTVMTIATAEALLTDRDFGAAYHRWGRRYPRAGYGGKFREWLASDTPLPYDSWGNGAAMRVSPVAAVATSEAEVLELARQTALPTHGHPRGIVGAQSVALATWMAGRGASAADLRARVTALSGYDLTRTVAEIRPGYRFDVSCDGSVPEAIICALEASSWEDAVRLAVSLGGDADTQAAIAGGIAGARFGLRPDVVAEVTARLEEGLGVVVGLGSGAAGG